MSGVTRRQMLRAASTVAVSAAVTPFGQRRARGATPVQVLSSRYPALEYYADRIRKAVPDLPVEMQMMPLRSNRVSAGRTSVVEYVPGHRSCEAGPGNRPGQ
jgi:hypothetical protein